MIFAVQSDDSPSQHLVLSSVAGFGRSELMKWLTSQLALEINVSFTIDFSQASDQGAGSIALVCVLCY